VLASFDLRSETDFNVSVNRGSRIVGGNRNIREKKKEEERKEVEVIPTTINTGFCDQR